MLCRYDALVNALNEVRMTMADGSEKMAASKSKRDDSNRSRNKKDKNASNNKGRVIKLTESQRGDQLNMKGLTADNVIFAMDIGTRTVVGVIGKQEDKCFRILATEVCEHKSRAMIDGQVHDVEQVAATAMEVKKKLEARIGFKLKRVAIAAAGRVLRTCQVKVEKNLEQGIEIDADFISSLEIEGIQRAQMMLDEELTDEDKTQFYCVGYSVINYYLNSYIISKLAGHKGKTAGVDILATFLPLIVVDSLYSVVGRIGLEVSSLTLEPIAAINVTIPQDIRLLNLALVDIGAGTSDIALTKDGSVFAYAMASIAGDEITERISQRYLVDFATAEKIKIALSSKKESIVFTDIMKIKHTINTEEVLKDIEETIQLLATTITQKILEYNHKAPNAIFMVGGGSRIPMLPQLIAQQLGLPEERVVVRSRDVIKDIRFDDKKLIGPESITPYGIAVTAQMSSGKDFLSVTVNERKIKLFNSKKLTVADALILYGFDAENLIGRSGKSITFSVNDDVRRVRGEYGKAAEIFLNGKIASLDAHILFGDKITVVPASDGRNAVIRACELTSDYYTGLVKLNGNPVDISTLITINGMEVNKDSIVNDGDIVRISRIKTLGELLEAAGFTSGEEYDISVNGNSENSLDYLLQDKDLVCCMSRDNSSDNNKTLTHENINYGISTEKTIGEAFETTNTQDCIMRNIDENTAPEGYYDITVNGNVTYIKDSRSQHIFVDIFNFIDFDLSKPQGTISLTLNGKSAAFTDKIKRGDSVEIYWKK